MFHTLEGLLQYEVVHPQRVDSTGHFISHLVSHHVSRVRKRQAVESAESLAHVFYNLQYAGQDLLFNLTLNPHLLAPGFLTERRSGGLQGSTLHSYGHSLCYFLGEVWSSAATKGQASISTCDGLTGLFKLSEEEFFIRPLEQPHGKAEPQAHVIYKRDTSQTNSQLVQSLFEGKSSNGTCGVKVERQRERWERRQHRRRPRSISREKWVETLVVADSKMVEHHGRSGVESYVLAVMNIVAGLFHDASIGNAINIVVVRLILLEKDEEDLKITHHADNSLNSFCKWQKHLNMKGDDHPVHHDVAVLLTRWKDICAATNKPCETLGLSHVAGMCQPHRSCSISEDTGLPLAFTVAHELGHNFGIQHDGNGNDCEPIGKRPFVMSPQLLYGTSPPNWSRCSRQYITRFLDRGWGWCLDDPPSRNKLADHSVLPGVLYSAAHQCRLQYGSSSLLCDDVDVRHPLPPSPHTHMDTSHYPHNYKIHSTLLKENRPRSPWCLSGECVAAGHPLQKVNGSWGPWSEWSVCTRTCGAGVQNAQRDCDNPVPKNGGRYCLGERLRYRICNREPCPPNQPSFRSIQCSRFNTVPYKGKFYKWMNVNNRINPCELHCRPVNEYFSEKMVDAVIDGTQCHEGSQSRDMCINGICKNIGCDYEIDSSAVEDRCGVCHGNGSTCETVKRTFEKTEGLGYVDIGLIPEGARDIYIEEVAEAGNFLALRSNDPEKYFLNGGWTIQWNGEYKAAGTVFTYKRTGQLENLTSPGPTMEPVWIQLLFQDTNPGVRYEYTISRESLQESINGTPASDFQWKHGAWIECSATCGTGVKRQIVHCVERTHGIVDEHYCDPATRPDDKRVRCHVGLCPAVWWTGEWQKCSSSCGEWGLTKRTVVCIRSLGLDEQEALQPTECQHLPRPDPLSRCNMQVPCPADWITGNWSECSRSCAGGMQTRQVTCSWNTGVDCDLQAKPASSLPCNIQECPVNVDVDGSGSGSSSKGVFNDINSIPYDNHLLKFAIGTTRAKPQDGRDLNNVAVDDFYYDYNFIKFHEDLSYDFDKEGIGVSDYSGIHLKQDPKVSPSTVYRERPGPSTATSFTLSTANPPTVNSSTSPGSQYEHIEMSSNIGTNAEDFITLNNFSQEPPSSQALYNPAENTSSMTSSAGPESLPHVELHNDLQSSSWISADLPTTIVPDAKSQPSGTISPAVTLGSEHVDPTRQQWASPGPLVTWATIDYNEINLPQLQSPTSPDPVQSPSQGSASQHLDSVEPDASSPLRSSFTVFWRTGNWKKARVKSSYYSNPSCDCEKFSRKINKTCCSTSCGLGAIWRSVHCSTGNESDCDMTKRPAPARRCYLRPCSTWKMSNWSKCSKNCGGGMKLREVQCYDMRDQRLLRPFHCQAVSLRPPARLPCNTQLCLDWYTSSWGQCSELCGGGEQQRLVTCPEDGRCNEVQRPSYIQPCNTQPCAQWVTGSWGQCSVSCGGGVQRRLVKCVNTKAEQEEEDEQAQCDHEPWPENTRQCNLQDCQVCLRDRLTFRLCQTLKWLGRCDQPAARSQCCKTCDQHHRGNDRATRR
uniref:A disintegrin-like and metallopeptidase (reprolysin type) with thrombospondin type 1 motif, 7 n=1 Tax=Pygocentrus nattereri TaxID=42514 RepID=A0AAR2L7P9_PYGNA